jgi:hypothetical protein
MSNDAKICPNCGWYFYWKDYIGEDDRDDYYDY